MLEYIRGRDHAAYAVAEHVNRQPWVFRPGYADQFVHIL